MTTYRIDGEDIVRAIRDSLSHQLAVQLGIQPSPEALDQIAKNLGQALVMEAVSTEDSPPGLSNIDPRWDLEVDPERASPGFTVLGAQASRATGIFVRARLGGHWDAHDIATLTRESLLRWFTLRPGVAEQVAAMLLEHPTTKADS